ncbi:NAD-dependent protein deacetylase, SIR2 family, partial [Collinsella sp. AM24-1]
MGTEHQSKVVKSLFDGFYHLYPSLEQQWAYYARYIDFMLRELASQPYLDLRSLIGHKDYFILSTNVDTQAEKTFPDERTCNYQGSFAHLQCKQPCCDELFDASPYVERMLAGMAGFEVLSEDIPRCPHCGWQLVPWVRDDTFLQGGA